jgi:hypothetical protein
LVKNVAILLCVEFSTLKIQIMEKIKYFFKKNLLWIIFFVFACFGVATKKDASIFISQGQYGIGKTIIWLIFFVFFSYSVLCSRKENFYKSIRQISQMYWGKQIIIDLYIGVLLPLSIIYLHGGMFIFLLWIIPIVINVNLFTLLYFALNYDSILIFFNFV